MRCVPPSRESDRPSPRKQVRMWRRAGKELWMASNIVVLSRDCEATQVPFGNVRVLPAGSHVRIMQSLGGSYTVATEDGSMLRVESRNADALGLTPQPGAAAGAPPQFSEKLVWDTLKTVYDPE